MPFSFVGYRKRFVVASLFFANVFWTIFEELKLEAAKKTLTQPVNSLKTIFGTFYQFAENGFKCINSIILSCTVWNGLKIGLLITKIATAAAAAATVT